VRIYDQVRARPLYLVDRTVNLQFHSNPDEHRAADETPYEELLEQVAQLLDAGTLPKDFAPRVEQPSEVSRPVIFPRGET